MKKYQLNFFCPVKRLLSFTVFLNYFSVLDIVIKLKYLVVNMGRKIDQQTKTLFLLKPFTKWLSLSYKANINQHPMKSGLWFAFTYQVEQCWLIYFRSTLASTTFWFIVFPFGKRVSFVLVYVASIRMYTWTDTKKHLFFNIFVYTGKFCVLNVRPFSPQLYVISNQVQFFS